MIFHIELQPILWPGKTLKLVKAGSALIINGDALDCSVLADGDEIPDLGIDEDGQPAGSRALHEMICGPISRDGEVVSITLLLPHTKPHPDACVAEPDMIVAEANGAIQLPFNSFSQTTHKPVPGGTEVTVKTWRFGEEPEIETRVEPNPPPPEPETGPVPEPNDAPVAPAEGEN